MPKIPFNVYDFFGYLASGFIFIFSAIYVGSSRNFTGIDPNFIVSIFVILLAYIIGHIVAVPSKLFFERLIVKRWLKLPSRNLFLEKSSFGFLPVLLPEYFDPFPAVIAEKIKAKAKKEGVWDEENRSTLYHHAYGRVKLNANALGRLDIFLSLYGFCRNVSFTLLTVFFFFHFGGWHRGIGLNFALCLFSFSAAVLLFYKYLKFFRLYTFELLMYYLELPPPKIQ